MFTNVFVVVVDLHCGDNRIFPSLCRRLWMMSVSRSRCTSPWSWRTSWGLDMISFHVSDLLISATLRHPPLGPSFLTHGVDIILLILSICYGLYENYYCLYICLIYQHLSQYVLNLSVSHTNLFTVVRGELTVPEEALKVKSTQNTHHM